ncbi:MAG: hypothetical protein ACK4Z5_05005 [Brevundimonas sp.]
MRFNLDLEVDDADLDRLVDATSIPGENLAAGLQGHAKAAFAEYLEQYVGRRALNRGTDILEHCLHLLIRHALNNEVPTEAQVSSLFQTTPSQSRTLIRNTLSKYRFELASALRATVKTVLEGARFKSGSFLLTIRSAQVVDVLKARLEQFHPGEVPLIRTTDASTWTLKRASYLKLCADFGATPVAER